MKKRIADLPANPAGAAVYRRQDGRIFLRLNDDLHVVVKPGEEPGTWTGAGAAEQLDPEEEVEVVVPPQ